MFADTCLPPAKVKDTLGNMYVLKWYILYQGILGLVSTFCLYKTCKYHNLNSQQILSVKQNYSELYIHY